MWNVTKANAFAAFHISSVWDCFFIQLTRFDCSILGEIWCGVVGTLHPVLISSSWVKSIRVSSIPSWTICAKSDIAELNTSSVLAVLGPLWWVCTPGTDVDADDSPKVNLLWGTWTEFIDSPKLSLLLEVKSVGVLGTIQSSPPSS